MSFIDAREHGAKAGSGGVASSQQEAIDRRERLRRLALETIDLAKDPYYMRNHLGQIECRLCLTLHPNEGNYLAHTQGKRHQTNLAKRAAREAADKAVAAPAPTRRVPLKKTVKIGRPGYRVTKQYDPDVAARSLLFQVDYPEIEEGGRPRHRFMSAYEQRVETSDKRYQYVLFAAEPYENIAFKIPNEVVVAPSARTKDKQEEQRTFSHWDPDTKVFSLQIQFKGSRDQAPPPEPAAAPAAPPPILGPSAPRPILGPRPPAPPQLAVQPPFAPPPGGFRPPPPPQMGGLRPPGFPVPPPGGIPPPPGGAAPSLPPGGIPPPPS